MERTAPESYSMATMIAEPDLELEISEVVEVDEEEEDDEPEFNFGLATRTIIAWDRPSPLLTIRTDEPKPISNFAAAFTRMHEEHRKRTSPDSEDNPQETQRRKSTESGDSTDNEILVGTAILDLSSPEKPTIVVKS